MPGADFVLYPALRHLWQARCMPTLSMHSNPSALWTHAVAVSCLAVDMHRACLRPSQPQAQTPCICPAGEENSCRWLGQTAQEMFSRGALRWGGIQAGK